MEKDKLSDKKIELAPGEVYTVEVASLGSAGYSWLTTKNNEEVAHISFTTIENKGNKTIGGSVKMRIAIKALKKGTSEIKLEHKRSWEKEVPPIDSLELKVVVK